MPAGRARLLRPAQLRAWVDSCLHATELDVLELPTPYRYAVGGTDLSQPTIVRIYARNISHGGGSARAPDEYRIQLTGVMPNSVPGETLTIIGWSESHQVFVGWDPRVHDERMSASPSLQVREEVMVRASRYGIAAGLRASGDVVIAFIPDLLAPYCLSVQDVHDDPDTATIEWLNAIGRNRLPVGTARPTVEKRLEVAYRAWDFRARIRHAYGHRCAICGLGLGLIEGAHIVPVAWPGSTDETKNGLAMCRNHHAAYDKALLSVTPDLRIELSGAYLDGLAAALSNDDLQWLQSLEGSRLRSLPVRPSDQPDPQYLEAGREARRWS